MNESTRPFVLVLTTCVALFILFAAGLSWYGSWSDNRAARIWPISNGYCNIAVIPIQGDIVAFQGDALASGEVSDAPTATSGDWVERYILDAESDLGILGIVAQIDSYGGYASPGHQMMRALERSALPTVAYIREAGLSSGYLAAIGADEIIAAPFAAVGSIGITYSYVENSEENAKEGRRFVQLSSGVFKDTGNPNKALTADEKALYDRDIRAYADLFIDLVAASRGLSTSTVGALADGSTMPAKLALSQGLIDQIGDEDTVREWFAVQLQRPVEEIVLCK